MLRSLLLSILVFASTFGALAAADWSRYVNPRFGAGVDIPANFHPDGPSPFPGEGKRFRAQDGRATITIWGAPTLGNSFMAETSARIGAEEAEGWAITYRSETPDWAAWSGTRAGHVFYAKSILVCNGTQSANVRFDYPAFDIARFSNLVNRLGQSLAQDGACF